ncbi:MAG: acyclic terpene utilization AtuA family protein [Saprospiraceae bacterium]
MSTSKTSIRIGCGAGYSGDRVDAAVELATYGKLDYLVFECLAERTIALAQQRRALDPEQGYDPLLEERIRACLPICARQGTKIITNMGAANPLAALAKVKAIINELGLKDLKLVAITGDEVTGLITGDQILIESQQGVSLIQDRIIAANAYLGIQPILTALAAGADVILTGRVADPALFLAPVVHAFGWPLDNYRLLGQGTVLGHLLECAGQVTGGYYADPGYKDVTGLESLGFPLAEVQADGSFEISKVEGSGGEVSIGTCTEQLLYEIHDPTRYYTPDVIADFSQVVLTQTGKDRVTARGGGGIAPTGMLKVSIGYREGFLGEGQISYGGQNAVARGKLAIEILQKRLTRSGIPASDMRFDLIGLNALYGEAASGHEPGEVRVRATVRTNRRETAIQIGREVEALYTNGPAGGGGAYSAVKEIVAIQSVLMSADRIKPELHVEKT